MLYSRIPQLNTLEILPIKSEWLKRYKELENDILFKPRTSIFPLNLIFYFLASIGCRYRRACGLSCILIWVGIKE